MKIRLYIGMIMELLDCVRVKLLRQLLVDLGVRHRYSSMEQSICEHHIELLRVDLRMRSEELSIILAAFEDDVGAWRM